MAVRAMTQTQLIDGILEVAEVDGLNKKMVKDVLESLAFVVGEAVENAQPVKVPGVGTLRVRVRPARKARMGRNPRTGEEVKIDKKPASTAISFRVDRSLKESLPTVQKARRALGK